jgi:four helix bundle protein
VIVAGERSYRDLVAWQKAMALMEAVYRESARWPPDERFGLTSQIRRAVVSVPGNIAEGSGRSGTSEFRHYLSIAHGSPREAQTYVEAARRLGFMSAAVEEALMCDAEEVSRILRGLIRSLS